MSVTVTANWMNAMNAIAESLREQRLRDIGTDVHVQMDPWDDADVRPGCYVTPEDVKHGRTTNSRNDKGYGCLITVVRGKATSRGAVPDRVTGWEEVVFRLFHDKRLCSMILPRTHNRLACKVETPVESDDKQLKQRDQQMEATSLLVRVWVREART